ncbi:ESX secretion-associated protein EspG [Nocardioides sp. SYSU DS0663]|uniref:ESX secretion-associated protein EspG n=1 Tax=Nocardioides sp. SYSU DS0663 TaxID=3416445 RepID=UPI003F4B4C9F
MSAVLLPRRIVLSRVAVEELARRAGTTTPWPGAAASPVAVADGDAGAAGTGEDPVAELTRGGLLREGAPVADVRAALEVLHAPELLVDLDLAVGTTSAYARLHSWQRWRAGCVAVASSAGGPVELAWFDDRLWHAELARALDARLPPSAGPPPDDDLRLPHDVLLATGEAVRSDRTDVLGELADRAGIPAEQARRLHASAVARLQVTVAGGGRRRTLGLLSWMRYADGWRALTPYLDQQVPMVRVHRVPAERLGVEVAALATRVRS